MRPSRFKDPRPLAGGRPPPAGSLTSEAAPSSAPPASASALDQLDEALDKQLAPKAPSPPPPPLPQAPTSPSASELVARTAARTAARLDQLERLLRTQEGELRKRDGEILRQQDELRALRQENRDMHKFLADYGLQWVGPGSRGSGATSIAASKGATPPGSARTADVRPPPPPPPPPPQAARGAAAAGALPTSCAAAAAKDGTGEPAAPPRSSPPPGPPSGPPQRSLGKGALPDMEAVRRAVSELNSMAEGGSGEIVRKRDGSHGFVTPSLALTFWKDGLQIENGGLRRYDEPDAQAFLRDLLDGYFPYEFKHAYPEGVLFSVHDASDRPHGTPGVYSWGAGRMLDSRGKRGETAHLDAPREPGATGGGGSSLVSGTRMWNNPADAEKSDVPAEASLLGAGSLVCSGATDGDSAAGGASCRIQVKGTDGQIACLLELTAGTTLASVHAALIGQSVIGSSAKYELRTAFPSRTLTEPNRTLGELGLAPSATLCVRLVPDAPR